MKYLKVLVLIAIISLLAGCTHVIGEYPLGEEGFMDTTTSPTGSYGDYSSIGELKYYEPILPTKKWKEVEVLNYSPGYFPFPPLCGYKVLHYESYQTQTKVDLFREIIDGDTFLDIISRRQSSDHCHFTRSFYSQVRDVDIVEANAECYVWLYGEYLRKYYFVRVGNIVYTFRLLSPPPQYVLAEPDFDYFFNYTIDKYLIYTPRQQLSPFPTQFAKSGNNNKRVYFTADELISFFAPVATQHIQAR